jgi:hypothetical protein
LRNSISRKIVCGHSQPHQMRPTAAVERTIVTITLSAIRTTM